MEETTLSGMNLDLAHLALSDLVSYAVTFSKNLLFALLVLIIGRFIISRIIKLMNVVMERKKVEPSLFTFLNSLVSITLNFLLLVVVIGILGIETSSFIALFASAGVAIGMALSGTLQNFAGGVMILIFKPYKVGDFIEAQGYSGTVSKILIFNTVLKTGDNQTIIIPNGGLSTGSLKNYSTEPLRRVDIQVEVAYGTELEVVKRELRALIEADSRILSDPAPFIAVTSLASSSVVFEVRVWVNAPDYWNVKFDMNETVYRTFMEKGITIPFQQLEVHLAR